jgi:hypothetical protein
VGAVGANVPRFPGFRDATGNSSLVVASRAGLFLTPKGLGGEYGVVATGSLFSPSPLALQLTLHVGDPNFGIYAQAGQLSDPTGRNLGSIFNLNVTQGASSSDNQHSVYVNEMVSEASKGQVSNQDVNGFLSATLLVGYVYNKVYNKEPSPNAFGVETSGTLSAGNATTGTGPVNSFTATALAFYTRSFNNKQNIFGVAIGGSYETGAGPSAFLRIGIGLDRPSKGSTNITGPFLLPPGLPLP